jgi:hypothetical protein
LVLLEGDGSALGRRAVLGVAPIDTITCRGLPGDSGAVDPFAALAALQASGGPWLGWLSYEAGAWIEASAHWQRPDMAILWAARHDPLIHFDRQRRQCWLQGEDRRRLLAMEEQLQALLAAAEPEPGMEPHWQGLAADRWHWHTSNPSYEQQVTALQERIAEGDGQITLKTRILRQVTFGKQRYRLALELHVMDNGPGVPDSIKDRIFFPLISGREGGSGLGLTLAQTFVQQHHGMIECDSEPGRTDFKILIPLP